MIEIEVPNLNEWRVIVDGDPWVFATQKESVKFIQYLNDTLKGRRDMTDGDIRKYKAEILQEIRKRKLKKINESRR